MILKMFDKWLREAYASFAGRLANKLALIFSLIVSVFIIALIMISYFRTIDILTNDFIENNKSILKLVRQSFDSYIQEIDELSLTLRKDEGDRIIEILLEDSFEDSNGHREDFNSYQNDKYIQNQLQYLFSSRQDIEEVRLYIPSRRKEFYISRSYANVRVDHDVDKQNAEWYKNATTGKFFRYIESGLKKSDNAAEPQNDRVFFTFHRALINIVNQKALAVVSISFNHSIMEKINWNEYGQNGEVLCIYDRDRQLFYSSDSGMANTDEVNRLLNGINGDAASGSFLVKMNRKNYLAVYNAPDESQWMTVKLIPVDMLNQKVRQVRDISLLIGTVFIILFVALVIFISNIITGSLHKLSRQMDKVGKGNFKIKADVTGNDEIAQLAGKFNFMVEQINELINEKYIAKISEKTAQLKALEAQINPHFLYNSLQAIASKAVLSGNKDISRMIEALAHNFRYCIKGGDLVRFSDEIEHINNYLILHKARYEDRLSVEVIVEDGTPDVRIPKLSIHTLVENSIKHCLEQSARVISIKIHTYIDDDKIIIKVMDNGPGMTEERLQEIKNELNDGKWIEGSNERIGLKNLNARLKLMYDNDASLELTSRLNEGTETSIILPMYGKKGA